MASKKAGKSFQNSGKVDRRKFNKGRVENLKPYPKGVSGNPGGRPVLLGESYKEWLKKIPAGLDERGRPLNPDGETNAEIIARAMGMQAMKGDVSAAKEIRSATEGDTLNATVKAEVEVFDHAVITNLLAGRSSGDRQPSGGG